MVKVEKKDYMKYREYYQSLAGVAVGVPEVCDEVFLPCLLHHLLTMSPCLVEMSVCCVPGECLIDARSIILWNCQSLSEALGRLLWIDCNPKVGPGLSLHSFFLLFLIFGF